MQWGLYFCISEPGHQLMYIRFTQLIIPKHLLTCRNAGNTSLFFFSRLLEKIVCWTSFTFGKGQEGGVSEGGANTWQGVLTLNWERYRVTSKRAFSVLCHTHFIKSGARKKEIKGKLFSFLDSSSILVKLISYNMG